MFDRKRVREEVASMIKDIDLVEKKDIQASKLSGGMKRKLRYKNVMVLARLHNKERQGVLLHYSPVLQLYENCCNILDIGCLYC